MISIFDVEFVQKKIFSKQLSKDFHRAFELRQISDYRSTKTPTKDQAEEVLKKAAVFVQTVKEYLQQ